VDPLALCLTLLGLALAATGRPKMAAPLLVLAVMTKQTYLAAPAAVLLALWPNRRAMLGFGALFVACLAAALAAAQALSGGWFFWHTAVANANPYDGEYLWSMLGQFLHLSGLPLLAAAAHFSLPARPGERLWRLYFLVALLALPTFGKMGASSNYWLELTAASAALIGLSAGRLAARPAERGALTEVGLAMMLVGALLAALPGYQATGREALQVLASGGAGSIRAQLELAPLLAAEPGELLTDEPALAVAAGRPIAFEFQIFQLLAQMGLWDERPILEAIAERRFALAVFTRPLEARGDEVRWSAAVLAELRAAYAPAGQMNGYWLYRPNSQPSAVR
jgi:hypothetical protein